MTWVPLTASETAVAIPGSMERGGWQEGFRVVVQLINELALVASDRFVAAVLDRPPLTGDRRFDALLAGVVEDLCLARGLAPPGWVATPERFLDRWWFVGDRPAFEGWALASSPAALAIRGVFVPRESLESV